jgi:PAS domain S-box-containing protein
MAEPALEFESYLTAIIESSEDAIISADAQGRIQSWNPAAVRMFGYAPGEVIGKPATWFIPSERRAEEEALLNRIRSGERIENYEAQRLRKDGTLVEVSVSMSAIKSFAGGIVGASMILRDITQAKRMENADSLLAAIVESSDDAIVSKNLDGFITSWNQGAVRMFGYLPEEVIGKSILLLIPAELHQEEARILSQLRAGKRIEHYETTRVRKDGSLVDVSLTISPVRNAKGQIIGASKIARDVSQRKRSEEALRRAEKLALAGRMAATVAHEINNPLAAITNLVYLLGRDPSLSAENRRRVEIIEQELERVSSIARQTLGFYRDNSKPSEFRLAASIDETLKLFDRRMLSRKIKVIKEIKTDGILYGFQGELRQVLANVLANAIDACSEGGQIRVRLEAGHRWNNECKAGVRLIIADNGCGIEPELKSKLFEPFFTTKKEVGTGLGLWLVSSLIAKHGGSIQVRSSAHSGRHGTVFSIFLPLQHMVGNQAA